MSVQKIFKRGEDSAGAGKIIEAEFDKRVFARQRLRLLHEFAGSGTDKSDTDAGQVPQAGVKSCAQIGFLMARHDTGRSVMVRSEERRVGKEGRDGWAPDCYEEESEM